MKIYILVDANDRHHRIESYYFYVETSGDAIFTDKNSNCITAFSKGNWKFISIEKNLNG